MKLSRLYQQVVKFGIERDPRINKHKIKSYPDTAILYADTDPGIRKILVGIDVEVGELLLADRMRRDQGLDLVISHHPEGRARAAFYEVMSLQVEMLVEAGIPQSVARGLLEERMREVERKVLPGNHMRAVDVAKLLNIPFMCVHTPADNQASWFMRNLLHKKRPQKVQDIVDILKKVPEYQEAARDLAGPRVILGNPKRAVGKIFVEMTGGTEGSKEVFAKLYRLGIRTLVSMHLSEGHFKKVKDANLNVVIAGHISSDTLGLNLLLDRIEQEAGERFQVINCSGFRRIRR